MYSIFGQNLRYSTPTTVFTILRGKSIKLYMHWAFIYNSIIDVWKYRSPEETISISDFIIIAPASDNSTNFLF